MDWPYNSKTLNILLGIQISVQLGVSGAIDQVFFKQKHLTPSYHSSKTITLTCLINKPSLISKQVQGVLCLRGFLRLWKNNCISRKPCKRRSDLVLNGQMRAQKNRLNSGRSIQFNSLQKSFQFIFS